MVEFLTEPEANESGQNWDNLNNREREVLIALLTSKNDIEAIQKASIGKTRYYELKKKLSPVKEQLVLEIGNQALQTIKGSSLKAARVLTQLLDSNNPNIKMKVAEQILTRTLGETPRQEVARPNITVIGIQGITEKDLWRLTQPAEDYVENKIISEPSIVGENN